MKHLLNRIALGLLAFLLVSVLGCSKEKGKYYTAVYGQVLDYNTGEPIPDVLIILKDGKLNSSYDIIPSSTPMVPNDSTYTDGNGIFFIELKDHFEYAYISSQKTSYGSYYTIDGYQPLSSRLNPGIYPNLIIRKRHYVYGE